MAKNIYDEDINFNELKQTVYKDEGDEIWYTCPLCGGEYLEAFITKHNEQTMCIDCWSERNPD